jgi:diguanylate cyclase (GGDEF)-like protein
VIARTVEQVQAGSRPRLTLPPGNDPVMNVTRYKCSVLVVDDDPSLLVLLQAQLSADFEVFLAQTVPEAREFLTHRCVDIVLTDLQLPGESGLTLLDWVRRTAPHTARILMTATTRIEDAVHAINQAQVHRMVLKPWRCEDLLQTLRGVARTILLERSHEQLLDELRQLNLELEQRVAERTRELELALAQLQLKNQFLEKMALTDPLTSLANLRAAKQIARKELLRRKRTQEPLTLILIDADHFGQVNKLYSQVAGDQVLVWLAGVLQNSIRGADSLGRVGGEEFEVVAPGTDAAGAEALAERLRSNVENGVTVFDGQPIRMTISLGLAVVERAVPAEYDQLRQIAADALKEAKASGRNRAVIRVLAPAAASE